MAVISTASVLPMQITTVEVYLITISLTVMTVPEITTTFLALLQSSDSVKYFRLDFWWKKNRN